jgi:uncharacterized protein (TIGR03083 family)
VTDCRHVFASAATAFAELVREVPRDRWDGPGLGEWTLRDLVGHTSRSLTTVSTYLRTTAAREDISAAADYYARMRDVASADPAAVLERGRQAGRDLGDDPAAAVARLRDRAVADVSAIAAADDPLLEVIGGLGIRLTTYLPTRTFELAVHSLDLAAALGSPAAPPAEVLDAALALAGQIAVATGQGAELLLALTGRTGLPPGFSTVF